MFKVVILQYNHLNDETHETHNKRRNNRHCTHLFVLQLILRAFKLEFVNGLQLNLFLAFLELCSRSLCTANFDIFNGYDHTLKFRL